MKIFAYQNNKFIEVEEVFFSNNSDYTTFHHSNKIFKIDMSSENRKRKREEDIFEENNLKLLEENNYIKERMARLEVIANMLVKKIAKSNLPESVEIRKIVENK